MSNSKLIVLDVGGSIVAPDKPDTRFLSSFLGFIRNWLREDSARKIIMTVGGGGAARSWQEAAKTLDPQVPPDSLDWVGVIATRLNAELVRAILGPFCPDPVVTDPSADFGFTGRVLLAAGWKPGFSTDYDAVVLAERFSCRRIYMLSNIAQIHDLDPLYNPESIPLNRITWDEYLAMTQKTWTPGANIPFDPVAARRASDIGLSVAAVAGHDLHNLQALLDGKEHVGTLISP
ncbi:MAG: UMP kinase [spirochete symbiont of Stewartia floridana]|nr:MAG: UMP kinase [spirochete symbiont of Stewartia floridana]